MIRRRPWAREWRGLLLVVASAGSLAVPVAPARSDAAVCARFGAGAVAGRVEHADLTEISGLAASRRNPGVYWTHNDSGGDPTLFALRLSGSDLGAYTLGGATATDWEDIAVGPKPGARGSFIYAADIGDNGAQLGGSGTPRKHVTIYRVAEPSISRTAGVRALHGVERFDLVYPGGPEDAEAMFVDPVTNDLVIITKSLLGRSRVLTAPAAALTNGARVSLRDSGVIQIRPAVNPSSNLPGTFVTAADISPDGTLILLRTYQAVLAFTRAPGQPIFEALRAGSCNAPHLAERQGEAIAIASDGARYVTISEGKHPAVHAFPIAAQPGPQPTTTTRPKDTTGDPEFFGDDRFLAMAVSLGAMAVAALVLRLRAQGRFGRRRA